MTVMVEGEPVCRHCGEPLRYEMHWQDIVSDARISEDQQYRDYADRLDYNGGWEHQRDHLPDKGIGLAGHVTRGHLPEPHDGRSGREEKMRQYDILLDRMNAQ